jgi:serine/threonine protein kinase
MPDRPSPAELKQFLLGALPPADAARVSEWVQSSPQAPETIRALGATADTFTASLRAAARGPQSPVSTGSGSPARTVPRVSPPANPVSTVSLAPFPPPRLGDFVLGRELGRGGMGAVFEAAESSLGGRKVALKVMRPEVAAQPQAKERFLREARTAALVGHENIVPIYRVGEADGVPFIAMPLLSGESLDKRLKGGKVPPLAEALRVGRQVADGLAAAHAAGLIHRDIKPSNIWLELEPGGAARRALILDFGLARAPGDAVLTGSGAVLGTPAYMPVEQARGQVVDCRADLYSLGVVLYQMTTGKRPFAGETTFEVLAALSTETPPPPAVVNPAVPAALSLLIVKLMSKAPAGRPQSAKAVSDELARIAALPKPKSSPHTPTVPPRPAAPAPALRPTPTPTPGSVSASAPALLTPTVLPSVPKPPAPPVLPKPTAAPPPLPEARTEALTAVPATAEPPAPPKKLRRGLFVGGAAAVAACAVVAGLALSGNQGGGQKGGGNDGQQVGKETPPQPAPPVPTGWVALPYPDAWTAPGGAPKWVSQAGYFEVLPGKGNIWTKELFGDCDIHLEYWLPAGKDGNSGVYVQGLYEVQIFNDHGKPVSKDGAGAIYGEIAPTKNASKPAEQWQTLDVTFAAARGAEPARVTVVHNGEKVLDDVAVTAPTKMASPALVKDGRGPLVLQDHGTAVRFRDVRVRPRAPGVAFDPPPGRVGPPTSLDDAVERLYLRGVVMHDGGGRQIVHPADVKGPMRGLYVRNLREPFTDADIDLFAPLPSVVSHILLEGQGVSDEGVLKLMTFHCARSTPVFTVSQCDIGDRSAEALAGPDRTALSLDATRVTDAGVAAICRKSPNLTALSLTGNTGVTDGAVAALADMRRLVTLLLTDTKVTEAAALKLGAALPLCTITYGNGKRIVPGKKP